MNITEEQTIWYPGIYAGRTEEEFLLHVSQVSVETIVDVVQKRAEKDGEWTIANGRVGDNEDKMRRMMAWVSDERNIRQCVNHIYTEKQERQRTLDWVCREMANASKWSAK